MKNMFKATKYSRALTSTLIRNGWHNADCKENSQILFPNRKDSHGKLTEGMHFKFSLLVDRRIASYVYFIFNTSNKRTDQDEKEYLEIIMSTTGLTPAKARKAKFKDNGLKKTKCKILTQTNPESGKVEVLKVIPK